MTGPDTTDRVDQIATEAMAALDEGRQVVRFSGRPGGLDLASAYAAAACAKRLREARGERPIGRKIGFTNRRMWDEYEVRAPIWGYVYSTTVHGLDKVADGFALSKLCEPKIEPEIVFGLARAPEPGMDDRAILDCVEWASLGFEIVQSIYPGWRFTAADTVVNFGLHGALLLGPRRTMGWDAQRWARDLSQFSIALDRDGEEQDRGHASNVLDGPLAALRHLVDLTSAGPEAWRLTAGEIVSTGTLTRAMPVAPGEVWTTRLAGIQLPDVAVRLR